MSRARGSWQAWSAPPRSSARLRGPWRKRTRYDVSSAGLLFDPALHLAAGEFRFNIRKCHTARGAHDQQVIERIGSLGRQPRGVVFHGLYDGLHRFLAEFLGGLVW